MTTERKITIELTPSHLETIRAALAYHSTELVAARDSGLISHTAFVAINRDFVAVHAIIDDTIDDIEAGG